MFDFSPQQTFITGPLSAKYRVLGSVGTGYSPQRRPLPLEDSRGMTGTQRGKDGGHRLGLQGLEPAQGEPSGNTGQADDRDGGMGALTGKIQLSPAMERSQVELGLRPLSM